MLRNFKGQENDSLSGHKRRKSAPALRIPAGTGAALFLLTVLPGGPAFSEAEGIYPIVDTGQSACYDSVTGSQTSCSGTGYDADYPGNAPSYTVSGDGTMVTDDVTGLTWTQTPDLDNSGTVDASDKRTQPDAETYCTGLSTGGHAWRLPSVKELYSLMDFRGGDPSGYAGSDASILTPFIDDSVFEPGFGDTSAGERIIDGQYATTTLYTSPDGTMNGAATMFGVNFIDGRIKGYPYDIPPASPKKFYVLCVTGNTGYGINDFADNRDQTVSDLATGLMWEQDDYQSVNFEDAVAHCESSTTAGHEDWRLPDIKELHSIADYSRSPDGDGTAAIDPLFNTTSFTNEGGETDWGYYWASTTHATYLGGGQNAAYVSFGRALGYFNSAVVDVHGAGAQRSNDKSNIVRQADDYADLGYGTFYYHGPQGDILRLDNMVRCVRDDDTPSGTNDNDVDTDDDGLIELRSLADLDAMRDDLAGTSLYGVTAGCPAGGCFGYELTGDLDLDTNGDGGLDDGDDYWNSGGGWLPAGDCDNPFTGTFNGNNFEIRNLMIYRPTTDCVGLFGSVDSAVLGNVGLTGDLTSVTGYREVGTLFGRGYGTSLTDCYAIGTANGYEDVGMLAGMSISSGIITRSFAAGSVTCQLVCGGLVGWFGGSIENSYAAVSVTGTEFVAGLTVSTPSFETVNSYAAGPVDGTANTAGLVPVAGTITAAASYWDMDSTGQTSQEDSIGIGLTTAEMQCPTAPDDTSCASGFTLYEGWDTAVWDFGTSSQYPALIIGGKVYRDSDGDGLWDFQETGFPWPMFLPAIIGR